MTAEGHKASSGAMRRRQDEIFRSGVMADIGSEGRLVFAVAAAWADYRTCEFKMSARGAARICGVKPTTIRRGLEQLIRHGVIEAAAKTSNPRRKYRFSPPSGERTRRVLGGHEACAARTQGVSGGAHEACPERTRSVRAADTLRARAGHDPCPLVHYGPQGVPQELHEDSPSVIPAPGRPLVGRPGPDAEKPKERRAV